MNSKGDKSSRTRRPYGSEEKVRLLKLRLADRQPISAICDQRQIHPTLFCSCQKSLFENGVAAFDRSPHPRGMRLGHPENRTT